MFNPTDMELVKVMHPTDSQSPSEAMFEFKRINIQRFSPDMLFKETV